MSFSNYLVDGSTKKFHKWKVLSEILLRKSFVDNLRKIKPYKTIKKHHLSRFFLRLNCLLKIVFITKKGVKCEDNHLLDSLMIY